MPLGGANALGASNVGLVSSFNGVQNAIIVPLVSCSRHVDKLPLSTILIVLWVSRMNCIYHHSMMSLDCWFSISTWPIRSVRTSPAVSTGYIFSKSQSQSNPANSQEWVTPPGEIETYRMRNRTLIAKCEQASWHLREHFLNSWLKNSEVCGGGPFIRWLKFWYVIFC